MDEVTSAPARRSLLDRLGLSRPELRAWAMYDWANSAMVTVIITAVFPLFYRGVANAGAETRVIDARFGAVTWISILAAALMAPVLGAIADYAGIRKRLLAIFMTAGVLAVGAMTAITEGAWILASVLFFLANLAATTSFVFYDALLPHVARPEEVDQVSTAGYALGYVGGGLVLALCLLLIAFGERIGLGGTVPVRIAFLITAAWWLFFSMPLLRRVPEPPRMLESDERAGANPVRSALVRIGETLRELRTYRHAFLLLVAFLIYSDGIGTIIRMAASYGSSIGLNQGVMVASILATQFIGIPFAFLFGMLAERIGPKPCVFIGLGVYVLITLLGYHMYYTRSSLEFVLLAILVGTVQGGTQALSRSMFSTMIPRHRSGEFFGLFGIMDRFAGSIGTGLMTVVGLATGNLGLAILAIAAFFILGAILLAFVDVNEGRRVARLAEAGAPAASCTPQA